MRTLLLASLFSFFLFSFVSIDQVSADVSVKGYYRKDGTYVKPHMRSDPDRSVNNNWSTQGNVNPYTGEAGTKPRQVESVVTSPKIINAPLTPTTISLRGDASRAYSDYVKNPNGYRESLIARLSVNYGYPTAVTAHHVYELLPDLK